MWLWKCFDVRLFPPHLQSHSTSFWDSREVLGHLCLNTTSSFLYVLFKAHNCECWILLVVTKDGAYVLDMAAKIDATADYICKSKWGDVEFPPPFGREAYPEVRLKAQYF